MEAAGNGGGVAGTSIPSSDAKSFQPGVLAGLATGLSLRGAGFTAAAGWGGGTAGLISAPSNSAKASQFLAG